MHDIFQRNSDICRFNSPQQHLGVMFKTRPRKPTLTNESQKKYIVILLKINYAVLDVFGK